MDFKQLRAFITVADTGNVSRAADLLNLVQPAVSRQLRLLEDDVGKQLFERERHGMVLTDAGRSLIGYARRAMLELERARAEMGRSAQGIGGLVTLGLLPSTCDLLAMPLVSAVAKAYPGIRMRIAMGYAGTLAQWLEAGEIDAALLYGVEGSRVMQLQALVEEALWVVGPRTAKLRKDRPVALASLVGKPLILPNRPHGIRTLVDHACAVSGVELTLAAETNSLSVQRSLTIGGLGLTILPPIAVAVDLANKLVSAAPLTEPIITRTIVLALPSNRTVGPHVRRTVDLLIACIKDASRRGAWPEARWLAG